jgi:hypothetical protein
MESLPLNPLLAREEEASGIKQAVATFSLSALLGAAALVASVQPMKTKGASRGARLRVEKARAEMRAAESSECAAPSPGSTPSR